MIHWRTWLSGDFEWGVMVKFSCFGLRLCTWLLDFKFMLSSSRKTFSFVNSDFLIINLVCRSLVWGLNSLQLPLNKAFCDLHNKYVLEYS